MRLEHPDGPVSAGLRTDAVVAAARARRLAAAFAFEPVR
jgi:hypothetical protein